MKIFVQPNPKLTEAFRTRLLQEWSEVDSFEGAHEGVSVPGPIIAADEQGRFIGGLSFTSAYRPNGEDICVWVNTVLVDPHHRGQGIASVLIEEAEHTALQTGIVELFVLSEFPALYTKRQWEVIGAHNQESILTKSLQVQGAR